MTAHPALSSRASDILSWDGHVDRMLRVEAALARAQAQLGIIPAAAAEAITSACERGVDRQTLALQATDAATPVIPLVSMLRQATNGGHGVHVHHGATSQDIIDTALVLQVRDAMELLLEELHGLGRGCARLADEHRGTVMVGRTLLQHAVPVTFGLKAAHWLSSAARHIERLSRVRDELPVQLGSAAGTLAPFGGRGIEVMEAFAAELALRAPDLPWHTDRDVLHEAVTTVGLVAGYLGKVAADLTSLSQTEIGELVDPAAGGSSTMPHKRNPVDPTVAAASVRLALAELSGVQAAAIQTHERAVGTWQAEWVAIPRVLDHTVAAAQRVAATMGRVEVDPQAMQDNLSMTGGAVMAESLALALTPAIGRDAAMELVSRAVDRAAAEGEHLRDIVCTDERFLEHLPEEELDRRLDESSYLGSTNVFIDRALDRWQTVTAT